MTAKPLIGITTDVAETGAAQPRLRAESPLLYADAVARAGGTPVLLSPDVTLVASYIEALHGFVFTGGADARTDAFGEPPHPMSRPVHPRRQEFEVALYRALATRESTPVLGICLGMQLMALCAGGRLNQHLPDDTPSAAQHAGDNAHRVRILDERPLGFAGDHPATSSHHQSVRDPGALRVAAVAPDGVIEALHDPARPFYVGVQWHPERTPDDAMGDAVFRRLVEAARRGRPDPSPAP